MELGPGARSDHQRAVDLAYRALSIRDRTVSELRAFLERKRIDPGVIDAAVAELEGAGYLDDARYVERFAEDKRTLEQWGGERIARELRRRGVAPDLLEVALAARPRSDELTAALELLRRRAPAPPLDGRTRDRAWRLLVRRGYEPELAYDAVRAHESRSSDRLPAQAVARGGLREYPGVSGRTGRRKT